MTQPATRSIWSRVADVVSLVATPLAPSHYVQLVNPLRSTHALQARVESVWDETPDARTITLQYFEALKTMGTSPATKFVIPTEFSAFAAPLAAMAKSAAEPPAKT